MSIFELESDDVCEQVVTNGKVCFIRYLSALERDRFEEQWQSYRDKSSLAGIRAFMIAFCLCDETGKPEFDSGKNPAASAEFVEAVNRIAKIKSVYLQPLFSKAMELNGFSGEEVDELEKKSD